MSDMVPMYGFGGGGGAALNFAIVGGTAQPTNPKENTIWVSTDTQITGWIFSATQPETTAEGTVWISTGTGSTAAFNALKKNGIMVYPLSASQYIDGEWVNKTAKSYQNGVWVDWWKGELYTPGNEWAGITGGWYGKPWQYSSAVTAAETMNVDREDAYIKMYYDFSNGRRSGVLVTTNKINLTDFDTLTFNGFISQNGYAGSYKAYGAVYVFENLYGSYYDSSRVAKSADLANSGNTGTVTLDISGLSGEYYIGIGLYTFDAAAAFLQMYSMVLT